MRFLPLCILRVNTFSVNRGSVTDVCSHRRDCQGTQPRGAGASIFTEKNINDCLRRKHMCAVGWTDCKRISYLNCELMFSFGNFWEVLPWKISPSCYVQFLLFKKSEE